MPRIWKSAFFVQKAIPALQKDVKSNHRHMVQQTRAGKLYLFSRDGWIWWWWQSSHLYLLSSMVSSVGSCESPVPPQSLCNSPDKMQLCCFVAGMPGGQESHWTIDSGRLTLDWPYASLCQARSCVTMVPMVHPLAGKVDTHALSSTCPEPGGTAVLVRYHSIPGCPAKSIWPL